MFSTYLADPAVVAVCSQESFIRQMLEVEIALAAAQAPLGIIPAQAATTIATTLTGLTISPESLAEGTGLNGVPIIPLLALARAALPESVREYLHVGATSQDILDTAQVLLCKEAILMLEGRIQQVLRALAELEIQYGYIALMGRTRTQQALPIRFGDKISSWRNPLGRHLERLEQLKPRLLVVQLGGPVGNRAALGQHGQAVAVALAAGLGLGYADSWHTQRDGFAEFANWLALVSGTLGKLGQDVLILGQTEIGEVIENRHGGGKSSSMPHKNNPILSEALVVLARQNAQLAALQLQTLVHGNERDATAWMLEWENLPRMMVNTATALRHTLSITQTVGINQAAMTANIH